MDNPFTGVIYNSYINTQREYAGEYKNGIPNGLLIYWYEDGTVKRKGKLKDGIPTGRWITYNEDGSEKKIIDY